MLSVSFDLCRYCRYCLALMNSKRLVAACFGLGWLPVAPGTWGSALPAGVFALLLNLEIGAGGVAAIMGGLVVAGAAACVICTPAAEAARGKSDPGEIVMDEVAGQSLTLLMSLLAMPAEPAVKDIWFAAILGFILFRIVDITKPWPIRKLERLPQGWGVLCDDLLAGAYAGVALVVAVSWYVHR
jgi:phosphatidylglycerophosphatase A